MASIPLQLITGFLGSGKTTFLKNYLEAFSGDKKIGIVQNEFSSVNVDSKELQQRKGEYKILEINNGSVFCLCLLGNFMASLAAFIDQIQPDELILEASGLSDPLSIGQVFQSPLLKDKVFLDHVWCLVDALNFEKISALQTRVNHQIRIADTIIVNKVDLTADNKDSVINRIKHLNPFAAVFATSFAQVDFAKKKSVMKFLPPGEKAENNRPSVESHVIKSNRLITSEKLNQFLQFIHKDCIRSKGYINLNSGEKVFLQGTFDQFTLQKVNEFMAPTEIIMIGNFPQGQSYQKMFENLCL